MMTKDEKIARQKIISAYKQAVGIEENTTNEKKHNKSKKWSLLIAALKESLTIMITLFPVFIGPVLGFVLPFFPDHVVQVYLTIGSLFIATWFVVIIYSYIKFYKQFLHKKFGDLSFEILINDYIINMLNLLYENRNNRNTKLIFAMGMNATVLNDAISKKILSTESTNTDSSTYFNPFMSITRDFANFMHKCFGIDIVEQTKNSFDDNVFIKMGDVFAVEYKINTEGDSPFIELNNCEFTVIHYVNSEYKCKKCITTDKYAKENEIVEDGRESVFHLIDYLSDYLYQIKKGSTKKVTVMIPAIGAGATGKAPYRNILIEIINCLSIAGYNMPDRIALSIRDFEVLENEFEASSLLRLASRIFAK